MLAIVLEQCKSKGQFSTMDSNVKHRDMDAAFHLVFAQGSFKKK
jgi:hypothetical protein